MKDKDTILLEEAYDGIVKDKNTMRPTIIYDDSERDETIYDSGSAIGEVFIDEEAWAAIHYQTGREWT